MKKLLIATLMLSTFALMTPALAEAGGHHDKYKKCEKKCKISKLKKKAKMLWKHKEYLELTEKQIDQIKEAKRSAIKKMIMLKAEVDVTKVDLKAEMWSDMIDTAAVNKLIDKKYDTKNKIAKEYVNAIASFQKTLNKEQRKKAYDLAVKAKMSKDCCGKCAGKSDCSKCPSKSGSKTCPLTGKSLDAKGSGYDHKGSGYGK